MRVPAQGSQILGVRGHKVYVCIVVRSTSTDVVGLPSYYHLAGRVLNTRLVKRVD